MSDPPSLPTASQYSDNIIPVHLQDTYPQTERVEMFGISNFQSETHAENTTILKSPTSQENASNQFIESIISAISPKTTLAANFNVLGNGQRENKNQNSLTFFVKKILTLYFEIRGLRSNFFY
jgi:hypothetical protein